MYRKTIYALLALLPLTFVSCSDDQPFETVEATDAPVILDPLFPDRNGDELPTVANISRSENFKMKLVVTPTASTSVAWFIDGAQVGEGTEIDQPLLAGNYHMRVEATNGKTGEKTFREGMINVNPLPEDPWSVAKSFERTIAPGARAAIYGVNLEQVRSLRFSGVEVGELTYDATEGSISYTVPEGVANGTHRLVLVDGEGRQFGANTVTVSAEALVIGGAERMTTGMETTVTGINLNTVNTLKLGEQSVEITAKSNTSLTVRCPQMPDGEYELTGTSATGAVRFIVNGRIAESVKVVVTSEITLWSGHHYVSWDYADGHPNKTFNLIGADVFANMKPGTKMTVHYSVEPSAAYHKMGLATGWWTDLVPQFEFSEGGSVTLVMTADILAKIKEQAGFICIGHGYYVDRVTTK